MSPSDPLFAGFLDDYFAECDEHLANASRVLLSLEKVMGDADAERPLIDELFRFFHSLKGISAMVEVTDAEQLAHHLEHYLRVVRARQVRLSAAGIEVLIDGTQQLERIVGARRLGEPMPSATDVIDRIAALATPADGVAPPAAHEDAAAIDDLATVNQKWLCTFTPTKDLVASGVGVDAIRRRLTEVGRIVNSVPEVGANGAIAFRFTLAVRPGVDVTALLAGDPVTVVLLESPMADASLHARAAERSGSALSAHVVRVDLHRLDELMRSVGDMVISRARLVDALTAMERLVPAQPWRAVQESLFAIDRQLRTLREGIMRARLVPVGEIFRRMPFVVRDLARESGKRITVDLRGQSTEIDKFLIERMLDPVLHLVRNAVSHGIELPADRVAAGKPPEGTLTLAGSAAGDTVTIEISDDGRGIDSAAVASTARTAGLPVPPGPLDAATLLALICAPGFSTREESDRISGRGVGMAVVKDTVEQLSGSMQLETSPGAGTRFTIHLPLTLAIADALIGRVGGESFAVPQSVVREVIEVHASDVRTMEQHEIVPHRGAALPVLHLADLFQIARPRPDRFHVFVVGTGLATAGLAVDRIIGQREIVVRAISDPLVRVPGVSGATDLGDGKAVLILDPIALTRRGAADARRRPAGTITEGATHG